MANPTYAVPGHPTSVTTRGSVTEALESEAALQRVEEQVVRVWEELQPTSVGASAIFEQAIRRATPIVPCVVAPRPLSARDLNRDLRIALVNYHPEEIRVVGYTLFSSIVELLFEKCGKRLGDRIQRILDSLTTTTTH
jgi:hypothetical protein